MSESNFNQRTVLTWTSVNLVIYILGWVADPTIFIAWLIVTATQGFAGLIMIAQRSTRLTGIILLIIAVVLFFVGMSICSQSNSMRI